MDNELIARMPIIVANVTETPESLEVLAMRNFTPHFKHNNMLVFAYLKTALGSSTWWVNAKGFQNAKNGRQAFRSIYKSVFGQAAMNARHTTNRSDVEALHYQGEKARQTFSTYVGRHKECHVIQSSLAEGGTFNDFTASEKVNFLLQGIKVSDLDAAVANIQSSPDLMSDFDQCCTNIADFIRLKQARTPGRARNVAAVDTHRGGGAGRGKPGGGRGHYGPSGGGGTRDRRAPRDKALDEDATFKASHITECWYPKDKFDNLTKLELHKLRMNQDEQRANEKNGVPTKRPRGQGRGGKNAQIAELATSIAAMQSTMDMVGGSLNKTNQNVRGMMAKYKYNSDENELFLDDVYPPSETGSNRVNPALTKTGVYELPHKKRKP